MQSLGITAYCCTRPGSIRMRFGYFLLAGNVKYDRSKLTSKHTKMQSMWKRCDVKGRIIFIRELVLMRHRNPFSSAADGLGRRNADSLGQRNSEEIQLRGALERRSRRRSISPIHATSGRRFLSRTTTGSGNISSSSFSRCRRASLRLGAGRTTHKRFRDKYSVKCLAPEILWLITKRE